MVRSGKLSLHNCFFVSIYKYNSILVATYVVHLVSHTNDIVIRIFFGLVVPSCLHILIAVQSLCRITSMSV